MGSQNYNLMYTGEHTHINTAGLIYEYYYSISSSDNINIKMVKRKLVYMCETCGKTEKDFTSKKNFFEHLQSSIHTNERFKCDQCDLDFQYLKGLNRHKSSKHEAQIYVELSC